MLFQSAGSPAEFKFQRSADDFVQVHTHYSFSYELPVPVSSMAFSLNKQIVVLYYIILLLFVLLLLLFIDSCFMATLIDFIFQLDLNFKP